MPDDEFISPCRYPLDDGIRRCTLDAGHHGEHWSDGRVARVMVMLEREAHDMDPTFLGRQIDESFQRLGAKRRGRGVLMVESLIETDPK